MKFYATFLLLAFAATCISAEHITNWGDVSNYPVMGGYRVIMPSAPSEVKHRNVYYETVSNFPVSEKIA